MKEYEKLNKSGKKALPKSYTEADRLDTRFYYTGVKCAKAGHDSVRYTVNQQCCVCKDIKDAQNQSKLEKTLATDYVECMGIMFSKKSPKLGMRLS